MNRDSIHVILLFRWLFRTLSQTKSDAQYTISDMYRKTRMKRILSIYLSHFHIDLVTNVTTSMNEMLGNMAKKTLKIQLCGKRETSPRKWRCLTNLLSPFSPLLYTFCNSTLFEYTESNYFFRINETKHAFVWVVKMESGSIEFHWFPSRVYTI